MKRRSGWENDPRLLALYDQARKNAAGSAPRKHHLIPDSYLRRWADQSGQVRVTEVDSARSYVTATRKAARETDFYLLESDDVDPDDLPPLLFETLLSHIEGWGQSMIDQLLQLPSGALPQLELDVEDLANFGWFLSTTFTRGQTFRMEGREMMTRLFKLQLEDVSDDEIRTRLRESGIDPTDETVAEHRRFLDGVIDGSIIAEPQDAAMVGQAGAAALDIGEALLMRKWQVIRCPTILLTCDEPIVLVGGPGQDRRQRAGAATAAVVIFPLSPGAMLAMWHARVPNGALDDLGAPLDHVDTTELNREIIANATRWVFEQPAKSLSTRLKVPPLPEQLMLEERTPIVENGREGFLFRHYRPTRWANTKPLPGWPVARWWN